MSILVSLFWCAEITSADNFDDSRFVEQGESRQDSTQADDRPSWRFMEAAATDTQANRVVQQPAHDQQSTVNTALTDGQAAIRILSDRSPAAPPAVQESDSNMEPSSDAELAVIGLSELPPVEIEGLPLTPPDGAFDADRPNEAELPPPSTDPTAPEQENNNFPEIVPSPPVERLPAVPSQPSQPDHSPAPVAGDFPRLPPDPNPDKDDPLPPLADELYHHGGSYMYQPEGDRLGWPHECENAHYDLLRLPEDWEKPHPLEGCAEFLGVGAPDWHHDWTWEGPFGYYWEPRLVGYGNYRLFGAAYSNDNAERYGIGHQLELELDLRLTGTERFHMQFKPIGYENTGGSYYQFNSPSGYINNNRATPDHYWFEGELHSMLGGTHNPFLPLDYNIVLGRFPFALHNNLLMNTDLLGAVISKNTIYCGPLSNLNVQWFAAREDIAAFNDGHAYLAGCHATADWSHTLLESSYVYLAHENDSSRNSHYLGLSATIPYGERVFALRALSKFGDSGGIGDGHLVVLESNRTRYFDHRPCGIEYGVFYCNAFYASDGWSPVSGGGFDRLRGSFEVNPLVAISAGAPVSDNAGISWGVQLFRHHEDESLVPEIAFQSPQGVSVYGVGLRYQRKTSASTFLEVQSIANFSSDPLFQQRGVLVTQYIIF